MATLWIFSLDFHLLNCIFKNNFKQGGNYETAESLAPHIKKKKTLSTNKRCTTLKTWLETLEISDLSIQGIFSCNKMLPQSLSPAWFTPSTWA